MANYLIPEPTVEDVRGLGYKGTLLYKDSLYHRSYYALSKDATVDWWAIGMIFNHELNGTTYMSPIVVSNNKNNAYTICGDGGNISAGGQIEYNGKAYYINGATDWDVGPYDGGIAYSLSPEDNIIPSYDASYRFTSLEDAAVKLLDLFSEGGGVLPGEEPSKEYGKVDYTRINWENKSTSLKTPINESNLNKMDKAINDLCENLDIAHTESEVKKLDKSSANKLLSETPTWDADTGILTFKFFDGTSFNVDFNIEKIPVSFSMDSAGVITMETADGTKWTADISKAIPNAYTFSNGARITFTETTGDDGTKKITADLVKGSITDEYLATDFLAKITSNVNAASSSATSAASSATDAAADAKLAQSYAIGGSGMRDGEDTDNAKYYAQKSAENLEYAKNLIEYGNNITD